MTNVTDDVVSGTPARGGRARFGSGLAQIVIVGVLLALTVLIRWLFVWGAGELIPESRPALTSWPGRAVTLAVSLAAAVVLTFGTWMLLMMALTWVGERLWRT